MSGQFLQGLKKLLADEKDRAAALHAIEQRDRLLQDARERALAELRPKINARLREISDILNRCAEDVNSMSRDFGFHAHVRGIDSNRQKALHFEIRKHAGNVASLVLAVTNAGVASFEPAYTNQFQILEAPDDIYEATVSKFIASCYHDIADHKLHPG